MTKFPGVRHTTA